MMTGNDVDIDRMSVYSVAHITRFLLADADAAAVGSKGKQSVFYVSTDVASAMSGDTMVSPSDALIKQLGFQQTKNTLD